METFGYFFASSPVALSKELFHFFRFKLVGVHIMINFDAKIETTELWESLQT